ncbi:MAG: hypothetical protein K6F44_02545 [Lachnospiraceae bacterium]|nr:hypothetical protein [Lachnospiraceae bacterium]
MQKNYRCPGCGATIEFLPETGKMYCKYCGNSYTPEEIAARERKTESAVKTGEKPSKIKMNILHCRSCDGELACNDLETSSFCPYCGQATVVLDRVEECMRPDYILPFKVTQEEAENIIRKKISSGFYIPKEIKEFKTEKLRGIYIPYWLYDMYYGDEQVWKYKVSKGKNVVTRYAYRLAEADYHNLTIDASKRLDNDTSERLDPYDTGEMKEFDPVYLSGFYSDRFDVGYGMADGTAVSRAGELFTESVETTIEKKKKKELYYTSPVHNITKREYALLPAWFLTFSQDGVPHTLLVNGQTGKMIGAVPCEKKRAGITFALLAIAFCATLIPLLFFALNFFNPMLEGFGEDAIEAFIGIVSGMVLISVHFWRLAIKKHIAYNDSIRLTQSTVTNMYVKERQDKE